MLIRSWTRTVSHLIQQCVVVILGAMFRLLASVYDTLRQWLGVRADKECMRIQHLAATTMEATVDSALAPLLEMERPYDYAMCGI